MLCEGTSTRPGGISPRDQAKPASGVSSSDNAFWDDWMFSNSASGICKFAWHAILSKALHKASHHDCECIFSLYIC